MKLTTRHVAALERVLAHAQACLDGQLSFGSDEINKLTADVAVGLAGLVALRIEVNSGADGTRAEVAEIRAREGNAELRRSAPRTKPSAPRKPKVPGVALPQRHR